MISSIIRINIIVTLGLLVLIACEDPAGDEQADGDELLPMTFPDNFTPPNDYLTGNPLEGWGGGKGDIIHTPIVFVHGNAHTADNWITMATYFAEEGYSWNELWAVSYLQSINDEHYNSNEGNWREIDGFVQAVLDYTGIEKVNVISHSLGVTVARTWLRHSNEYHQIETFIGIAGANHGVAFCGPNDHRGMCGELGHPESEFLHWLNGEDETPFDDQIQWITLYNGEDLDMFFPKNALMNDNTIHDLRLSPILQGATNIRMSELNHFQLTLSESVYDTIKHYLNLSY